MKRKLRMALVALMMVCSLSGCGKKDTRKEVVNATVQEESTVSQIETETEEPEQNDTAILVVSFGTSYNDNRDLTIGAIETAIADAFPEYEVRRAFTSQIIIDKLKERDKLEIDNVEEALDRAAADGIKELIVQPTHLMDGYEYHDLAKALTDYLEKFDKIILAEPLLSEDADFEAVIKAITERTADYDDGKTAICFMGHGTEAESNAVYAKMQEMLTQAGYENYYIGTVEAEPSLNDVIAMIKEKGNYEKVMLQPLMVVAGDHANNDMAGEEEDSWKSILEKEGYAVSCVLEGLGQIEAVQDIYVGHIQTAISAGTPFAGIADIDKSSESEAASIDKAGVYFIEAETSSSMFNIVKTELTVAEDGSMTADITMSGTGYTKLYMGTGEQAATVNETDYIPFVEDAEGAYIFTIPVAALDQPIDCAAFSKKKEEWYDRQITFLSTTLSADAPESNAPESDVTDKNVENMTEKVTKDGTYTIDITFEGGSGKSKILSPATVTIAGDNKTATVQWNSENYDYMIVDGQKYLPISTEGGSVFEIPIGAFDEKIVVIGDTIAMSKPHEIEYTITFHSETMKPVE